MASFGIVGIATGFLVGLRALCSDILVGGGKLRAPLKGRKRCLGKEVEHGKDKLNWLRVTSQTNTIAQRFHSKTDAHDCRIIESKSQTSHHKSNKREWSQTSFSDRCSRMSYWQKKFADNNISFTNEHASHYVSIKRRNKGLAINMH